MSQIMGVNLKNLLCSLVVLLSIAGCAAPQQRKAVPRAQADLAELAKINTQGTSKVSGQAFLRTLGGDVKKAAGSNVVLNPVSSLSNQWYWVACVDGNTLLGDPPKEYVAVVKQKKADAEGKFSFENVADGEYFLATNVVWQAPVGRSLATQGGLLMKKVTVKGGEPIEVILTDEDLCKGGRTR